VLQSPAVATSLNRRSAFDTVPRMPPQALGSRRRPRRGRPPHKTVRFRRFAGVALLTAIGVLTLALTAFGPEERVAAVLAPAPADRLLPSGPPDPLIVAVQGSLRIQVPIEQNRVTAIGYHGGGDGALALEPLGRRGNQGLLHRIAERIFGAEDSSLVYYQLGGGAGPGSSALDVGATPGTDVYAPVDGTVVGITDYFINDRAHGVRIDVRPLSAPSVVVSVTRLKPDPVLTVGSSVAAGSTRLGTVLDLSSLERMALARYTQDAGNHVTLQVSPAAALSLP
jgi:hypothetical protein